MTDSSDHSMDQRLLAFEELLTCYATLEIQWHELDSAWVEAVANQTQADSPAMQDIKHRAYVIRYQTIELLEKMAALEHELS